MAPFSTSVDDRVVMLRNCLWAQDLPADAIVALAERTRAVRIPRGGSLVEEQDAETWMGFVIEGECEITQSVLGADDRVIRVIGPGRVFGEMALLDGSPRSASIDAIENTTVLRLSASDIERMADDAPRAAYALMRRIATDLSGRIRRDQKNRF